MEIKINYWGVAYVKYLFNLYNKNLFEVSSLLQENDKKTF